MGQSTSFPSREHRRSMRSFRSSMSSKSKKHSMSATFNILEQNSKIELLNVNVASEEELMTLAGVTRDIARNVVQYRRMIGRFKKIDDLALVPGMGAEKLHSIRSEVCVRRQRTDSDISYSINSLDSITSSDSCGVSRSLYVNINKASVFELQSVEGITQEIAANIVHSRERKGPFKSVYDLRKVKGVDSIRFGVMRAHVAIEDDVQREKYTTVQKDLKSIANGYLIDDGSVEKTLCSEDVKGRRKANDDAAPYMRDIFDLLSTYSHRPVVENFRYERNGKKCVRVCSWNLYNLTTEKAENPGFLEVCCRTILENRLTILAVQEIYDELALKQICNELNEPTLKRIVEWKENSCNWKYFMCNKTKYSEHLGFIYNSKDEGIEVELVSIENILLDNSVGKIVLVKFEVGEINLSLININTKSVCLDLQKTVQEYLREENDTVVLGDFSGLFSDERMHRESSCTENFSYVLPFETNTCSAKSLKNSIPFFDNICLNVAARKRYTGFGAMIRDGLTHLAIPRGWTWGGVASEHCPVWCELYIDDRSSPPKTLIDSCSNGAVLCNGTTDTHRPT